MDAVALARAARASSMRGPSSSTAAGRRVTHGADPTRLPRGGSCRRRRREWLNSRTPQRMHWSGRAALSATTRQRAQLALHAQARSSARGIKGPRSRVMRCTHSHRLASRCLQEYGYCRRVTHRIPGESRGQRGRKRGIADRIDWPKHSIHLLDQNGQWCPDVTANPQYRSWRVRSGAVGACITVLYAVIISD